MVMPTVPSPLRTPGHCEFSVLHRHSPWLVLPWLAPAVAHIVADRRLLLDLHNGLMAPLFRTKALVSDMCSNSSCSRARRAHTPQHEQHFLANAHLPHIWRFPSILTLPLPRTVNGSRPFLLAPCSMPGQRQVFGGDELFNNTPSTTVS